ncbi:Hypothetical protein A7982_02102 [Minicystis rosea]|nr:Hypothetical protein A7982_02102 [Minicystis rosea]
MAAPILLASSPAAAVQINMALDGGCLVNPDDPDGSKLMAHAQAAAQIWMDLLPADDNTVFDIDICWDHSDDGTTVGGGRPPPWPGIWIERSPPSQWFFDPTPLEGSEFDMRQTLFRDLPSTKQIEFFEDDPPPALMEVGFEGTPKESSPANGKIDLLTVILHEIGHKLGVNYAWGEDYDIEPFLIGGFSNTDIKATLSHLTDTHALMTAETPSDLRRLPSATDLFALVDDEDYTSIRLQRMDLLGNAWSITPDVWDLPMNWEGGSLPSSGTDVFLRKPATVFGQQQAGTLTLGFPVSAPVDNGLTLHIMPTAGLTVGKLATISLGESMIVEKTGTVSAQDLDVSSSTLQVNGGAIVVGEKLQILRIHRSHPGRLHGHGSVSTGTLLLNEGEIAASDDGSGEALSFDTTAGTLDLDGNNPGALVDAENGDIAFANGVSLPFGGKMRIGSGHEVSFLESWTLEDTGQLLLKGSKMLAATFRLLPTPAARRLTARGSITVQGRGIIDAAVAFEGAPTLSFQAGSRLDLARITTYEWTACTSTNVGMLRQLGDAEVKRDTALDVEIWDGDGDGSTKTTIDPGVFFSVSAQHIGDDDLFHGSIENRSGMLLIDAHDAAATASVPWTLGSSGLLHLDPVRETPMVIGSDIVLFGGHVLGEGDISTNLDNRAGVVEPAGTGGDPIGTLAVVGEYTYSQGSSGELRIDLVTNTSPYRNDRLQVAKTAWLGGTLRVSLIGPEPPIGTTFDILTSGQIIGTFPSGAMDLPIMADKSWDVQYLTGVPGLGDVVRLVVIPHV